MSVAETVTSQFAMTPDETARYHRDGFLIREGVFDAKDLTAIAHDCETLVNQLTAMKGGEKIAMGTYMFERRSEIDTTVKWEPDFPDQVQGVEPFAHYCEPLKLWGYDPRLTDPAKTICGADELTLFTEKLNLKRAHQGGHYILHQDFPYWEPFGAVAHRIATAMIFVDDSNRENGCLEVAPGSHTVGKHPQRTDVAGFGALEIDNDRFDLARLQPVEVKAGAVVFFGAFLAHRSGLNRSGKDRRALLYSYQPAGNPHATEARRRIVEAQKAKDQAKT